MGRAPTFLSTMELSYFRKGRGTRDPVANTHWIIEKAREFGKNSCLYFIDYTRAFDRVHHNKLWKALKDTRISDQFTSLLRSLYGTTDWGAGLRKGYDRAVCCHPVYLAYTLSTS